MLDNLNIGVNKLSYVGPFGDVPFAYIVTKSNLPLIRTCATNIKGS